MKHKSALTFRHGGMAGSDLNRDIGIPSIVHRCRHANERYFGMRVPPTEHVPVGGLCAQIWLANNGIYPMQER